VHKVLTNTVLSVQVFPPFATQELIVSHSTENKVICCHNNNMLYVAVIYKVFSYACISRSSIYSLYLHFSSFRLILDRVSPEN